MRNVKSIAIYLPQYYETAYNNRWWGKGFTDWVAVRNAIPCFDGHVQPKVPLDNNYYNLLDKSTFKYQQKLMKRYGIYGLCFYHYYFKNGIKVLEKPAENLLEWKDIDIPFCFCWPSENWIRTWSNLGGNVWGEKFDKGADRRGEGVLLEQNFGSREEWKVHFDYLYQFFKDERYIKIDGKPIFMFFNTEQVFCIKEMTKYWIELARQKGLNGIYFIGCNISGYKEELDAVLVNEPAKSRKVLLNKGIYTVRKGVTCVQYSDFVDEVLNTKPFIGTRTYFCGTPGFDTTPRRGYNGEVFLDNSPELFERMMDGLYKKTIENGNEYVFINAWNEWGEGMYLEPDEENGFAFLETVKKVNDKYKKVEIPSECCNNFSVEEVTDQLKLLNEKVFKFRWLFDNTVALADIIQNNSHRIKEYFEKKDMHKIAVYGVGSIGRLLINQFMKDDIKIAYTVDIYAARVMEAIPMYRPYEEIPQADILIVTVHETEKIIQDMQKKGLNNVVSIEWWMNELMS